MDLKLKGRIALVAGSMAGIGFAIARQLAAEAETVTAKLPAVDVLVNNVGIFVVKAIL